MGQACSLLERYLAKKVKEFSHLPRRKYLTNSLVIISVAAASEFMQLGLFPVSLFTPIALTSRFHYLQPKLINAVWRGVPLY